MKLIQVVPDAGYFIWQLYVQMQNFREHGVEEDAVILVALSVGKVPSPEMKEFERWTNASVLYYNDARKKKSYISSLRPHILAQYFRDFPTEVFFYHDQDIIFIEPPKLGELGTLDDHCYVAGAAHSYTSASYIKQFKPYIFPSMAEIVGIDTKTVEENDSNCGGAQYIIKGVTYHFWEKVERDCEGLYSYLDDITTNGLRKYREDEPLPEYHIQIWCADMWALFWNLLLLGKKVRHHHAIDFSFPWEKKSDAKPIMHNAGITAQNEELFFNKSRYNGSVFPFEDNFDYVPSDCVQHYYVSLFKLFRNMPQSKRKVLGIFCTTNKIHPNLLKLTLDCIKNAADNAKNCMVEVVTISWEIIPNCPFPNYITPYRNLGHLNYVLQMKQGLLKDPQNSDIVCILEHDVMYPDNYFDVIVDNWSANHYGVCNNNYIGMNQTGYLDVVQRHQPMSLMSFAKFFFTQLLSHKIDEIVNSIGDHYSNIFPYGWCCVEPDDKSLMNFIDFTDEKPAIHVNMNKMGKDNHHFTGHADVCYEQDSNGKTYRHDWGLSNDYFTFN